MNIQHDILSFDQHSGSIVVKYWATEFPDGLIYNIDLPIVDGSYPSDSDVLSLIELMKPVGQLERLAAVKIVAPPAGLVALIPQPAAPRSMTAADARAIRDHYLAESDWTQLSDAPINVEEKSLWAAYRQELRDVPEQPGFPENVVWPTSPADAV